RPPVHQQALRRAPPPARPTRPRPGGYLSLTAPHVLRPPLSGSVEGGTAGRGGRGHFTVQGMERTKVSGSVPNRPEPMWPRGEPARAGASAGPARGRTAGSART